MTLSQLERVIDSHKAGENVVHCLLGELPLNDRSRINIVARRKLADWIESGYLELYQRSEPFTEMFCFGMGASTKIAGQILELPEHGEARCLITRSEQGVSDAYKRLQALIKSGKRVPYAALETPDSKVAFLKRDNCVYNVDELRDRIGLTEILQDRILVAAEYSDRYFEKQRGQFAGLLARLLNGPWINADSIISIRTNQLKEEFVHDNDLGRHDSIRHQLEAYPNFRVVWRNFNQPGSKLEHGRFLRLTLDNKTRHIVIFDKGLDFVRRTSDGEGYIVVEKNYIVRTLDLPEL